MRLYVVPTCALPCQCLIAIAIYHLHVKVIGRKAGFRAVASAAYRSASRLRGNLAGFHTIGINQQWRLIFRWDETRREADGICLDAHSYR